MAYRGSGFTYKIRKITTNNNTGDAYGITICRDIAMQFQGQDMFQYVSGNAIIIESGNKALIKNKLENIRNRGIN